jgi:type I restriction enzyme R subunit
MLEVSLARLSGDDGKYETLKDNITEVISELPLSVNIVARQEELIKKAQEAGYWAKAVDETFDELSNKLSALMKYRDGLINATGPAKFDFTDLVNTKEKVVFGPDHSSVPVIRYKEMVEKLITELTQSNPILRKIRDNKEITKAEADSLAETLHNEHPHITEELLKTVYKNRRAKLVQFIRHILGLEILESFPDTVTKAFEHFTQEHTYLTARQLDFLGLLKSFMLERESIQKRDLIEPPFTVLHPEGIRGLFSPREIEEIVEMTKGLVA